MKKPQKIIGLCAIAFSLIPPSLSLAGGTAGDPQILTQVQISGGYIFIYGRDDWLNPNACTDSPSARSRLVLNKTDIDYSEKYALLVASYLQGKPIKVYSNNCIAINDGVTVPEVSSIDSYE